MYISTQNVCMSEISACTGDFDQTKYMTFVIKDDEFLKNTIKSGKRLKILS